MDMAIPSADLGGVAFHQIELEAIEKQLTQAAELAINGTLSSELANSLVVGALGKLPLVEAPLHIAVLKRLKRWFEAELISLPAFQEAQATVLQASRDVPTLIPPPGDVVSAAAAREKEPQNKTGTASNSTRKRKQPIFAGIEKGKQQTMFEALPRAKKTLVEKAELVKQRKAAVVDNEHYSPKKRHMASFDSETAPPEPTPVAEHLCAQCGRIFDSAVGLRNHSVYHTAGVREKFFTAPRPKVYPPVTCTFTIQAGTISVGIAVAGKDIEVIAAEVAAAELRLAARQEELARECARRKRASAAAESASQGGRRGSRVRKQYTPKERLELLAVFDEIMADPTKKAKMEAFQADLRTGAVPYVTVYKWTSQGEREKILRAAGQKYASTLLRIDATSRKVGGYGAMEKELYQQFKARRARGRKVSARWLSATARNLCGVPNFRAGKSWRWRFSRRFNVGVRRKTNVKNKTWADSEPVLLRYFTGLRKRLQLDNDDGVYDDQGMHTHAHAHLHMHARDTHGAYRHTHVLTLARAQTQTLRGRQPGDGGRAT